MYHWLKRHLPPLLAQLLTACAYACLVLLILAKWSGAHGGFRYLQL